jgi:histidyl-tRNA synthetase
MRDILPPESGRWRRFVDTFAGVVEAAGYGQIIPPIMEDLGVFLRVGEATDIVTKEMYDFEDKGGRRVALRPELTASVCRAMAQHRPQLPWKVWYSGPMFRYEKPQRGRYRQFDQVGIEVFGVEDPLVDVEVIALGWRFYQALGLQQVELIVNSLGEPEDRARYVAALQAYFEANIAGLTEESKLTLAKNPLRVLDSKRDYDAAVVGGAPKIAEFYSEAAAAHFAAVTAGLDALGIPYTIDPKLVRGLDYYRGTTFEYAGGTLNSAQNALGGGGRYGKLVEELGGPPTPGIGFALGLDRTLLACDDEGVFEAPLGAPTVFVVDTTGGFEALRLTEELRCAGINADRAFDNRSMKSQMKASDRSGAEYAVLIGSNELEAGMVTVRPLRAEAASQSLVPRNELIDYLKQVTS